MTGVKGGGRGGGAGNRQMGLKLFTAEYSLSYIIQQSCGPNPFSIHTISIIRLHSWNSENSHTAEEYALTESWSRSWLTALTATITSLAAIPPFRVPNVSTATVLRANSSAYHAINRGVPAKLQNYLLSFQQNKEDSFGRYPSMCSVLNGPFITSWSHPRNW